MMDTSSRLLKPQYRKDISDDFKEISWSIAISKIAESIKKTLPQKMGFYLSDHLLTEDYYVVNKLAKGFIGTNNIDTSSKTGMASSVIAHTKAFGADLYLLTNDLLDPYSYEPDYNHNAVKVERVY